MSFDKRLAVLELFAKVSTVPCSPEIIPERVAQILARFKEILAVEDSPMTHDEQIAEFKAGVGRLMDARQARNGN